MKRFIVSILVLAVIAAVIFYFGWIQLKLDEDTFGVVFTKTGGWEDTALAPGDFAWRVQRLLPTNLTLHLFPVTPRAAAIDLRGSLPSATEYGSLLESPAPFSYAISLDIVYRLRPAALPRLARTDGLRADTMNAYYERMEDQMNALVSEAVLSVVKDAPQPDSGVSATRILADSVTETIGGAFPDIELISVSPRRVDLPDPALYEETRRRYLAILDARSQAMQDAAGLLAEQQTDAEASLSRLERYGDILTRYPVLLDYFTLTGEMNADPLALEPLVPGPAGQ